METNHSRQGLFRLLEHLHARQVFLARLWFALETALQEVIDLCQGNVLVGIYTRQILFSDLGNTPVLPIVVE